MTAAATYSLTKIMTDAHTAAKACLGHAVYKGRSYASLFAGQLSRVWAEAKRRVATAKFDATMSQSDRTRAAIASLESKDRWTQADYARIGVLRAALRAAEEHEALSPDYAAKRYLIASAGGRFCAVTFTKVDGTERTMQVQPATLQHHVKGDSATEAGKRATATRKARHPHLMPVWDAKAQAPRSVNLATISRIAMDGVVHEYRA
ncbi:hypothetical protein SAMN04488523_105314 [Sulfitobacter brevis]|uniref:Uncharacterized protein n=1 Tax=Sulfitobacter brevis TaxID=74348 RepID=A0A1I1YME3_9RHOB|nr:hypothetical protein [Sulfitobacter brevis]SFE20716.1 hypothetical protein SAMN04488523_105314 [Sulfitobacter brevis]